MIIPSSLNFNGKSYSWLFMLGEAFESAGSDEEALCYTHDCSS